VSTEVLIPHLDRAGSLKKTLESLRAQTVRPDICVVDNGSSDGSVEMLRSAYPEVRLVLLERNHGFGGAINHAARSSAATTMVLLNNDAVADSRFIEEILACRDQTHAEMIAACLRRPDGAIESLGVEVDSSLIAYDLCFGCAYPDAARALGRSPLGPTGGAGGYDRQAFLAQGGFDERIFAYLEDVDLAIRMRSAGSECGVAWKAFAWHEHSGTLGSGSQRKNRLMGASRCYLLWKHGGALGTRARLRGHVIDGVVYAGQIVRDRNAAALKGRVSMARKLHGSARPPSVPLPSAWLVERTVGEALAIRAARRPSSGAAARALKA